MAEQAPAGSNPLLRALHRTEARRPRRDTVRVAAASAARASASIFLVLRRMRAPLIVLIVIFAVSVLGLTLIPGEDAEGRPYQMGIFDAFYVMSYTATTIGFGEIPYPFTYNQRMWVTFSIYLSVIGWAYAIGSLLALLRDRAFRQALALQHFTRKVNRLVEPFVLIAGYGRTGELLGHSLDRVGRRFVVLDVDPERIDGVELDTYLADVPGLTADARDPGHLAVAGLDHPCCEAVVALTDDEEANLAVVMTAALLRPDVRVVSRVTTAGLAHRMQEFGNPSLVNAFDRFGDHLRLALKAPASYQLLTWLEGGPGAELPERGSPPRTGRWVVCGYGRLGRALTEDLRAERLAVTVIDPDPDPGDAAVEGLLQGDGCDPWVMAQADLDRAVGFVAATDNDTTNLSLVAAARRANPGLFVGARQNRASSAPLFEAMDVDALLVPSRMIAEEIYAQLSTPLLWRFIRELPAQGEEWARQVLDRIVAVCGRRLDSVWRVRVDREDAPALVPWLGDRGVPLGDLLRHPDDRRQDLDLVVLLVLRGSSATLAPAGDVEVRAGDELLVVGRPEARRALSTVLAVEPALEYVVSGRRVASGWLWRRIAGTRTEPREHVGGP